MLPEVPAASRMILADRSNYLTRPPIFPGYDLIVIHCTDGHPAALGVAQMWQQPGASGKHTSAHFVIGQDGEAIQCVPLAFAAQHAHNANAHSVGIEHCARTPGEWDKALGHHDPGLPPSDALYAKSAELVAYLLVAAGLPCDRDHVKGHAEADPATTHTRCPDGCGWDWDAYMSRVRIAYEALGSPPAPLVA